MWGVPFLAIRTLIWGSEEEKAWLQAQVAHLCFVTALIFAAFGYLRFIRPTYLREVLNSLA